MLAEILRRAGGAVAALALVPSLALAQAISSFPTVTSADAAKVVILQDPDGSSPQRITTGNLVPAAPEVVLSFVSSETILNGIPTSDGNIHIASISNTFQATDGFLYTAGDRYLWNTASSQWSLLVSSFANERRLISARVRDIANAAALTAIPTAPPANQQSLQIARITSTFTSAGTTYRTGEVWVLDLTENRWERIFAPAESGADSQARTQALAAQGAANAAQTTANTAISRLDLLRLPDAPANTAEATQYGLQVPATSGAPTWTQVTGGGGTAGRKLTLAASGTNNRTVTLPADYATYDVALITWAAGAGEVTIDIDVLAAQATITGIRSGGSARINWNRSARTLVISESSIVGAVLLNAGSASGSGSGLTQDQVDARIATYARATPTGQIADAQIPASIARDSELPTVPARAGAFTQLDEDKLDGIANNAQADQTGPEIRDLLEGLTGNDRLNATAIRNLPSGTTSAINAGTLLSLAQPSRDTTDRGKALGTSTTDEDALALLTIPAAVPLAATSGNVPVQPTTTAGNAGAGAAAARWDHRHPLPAVATTSAAGLMRPQDVVKLGNYPAAPLASWTASGSGDSRFTRTEIPTTATGMSFRIAGRYGATGVLRANLPRVVGGDYQVDYRDAHGLLFVLGGTATTNFNVSLADLIGINEAGGAIAEVTGTRFYVQNNRTAGNVTFSGGGISSSSGRPPRRAAPR